MYGSALDRFKLCKAAFYYLERDIVRVSIIGKWLKIFRYPELRIIDRKAPYHVIKAVGSNRKADPFVPSNSDV